MVATDVLADDDVIYEVGVAPPVQNAVRPTLNNPLLARHMSTAEKLSKKSMERKIQAGHIVNHHGAMQMFLANANLANVMGLSDDQKSHITPFPARGAKVTIVNDGSNEKLIGVVGDMFTKLVDKLPATPTQPTQSGQSDTQQSDTGAVQPTASTWWESLSRYGNPLAWGIALASSILAGTLAWQSTTPTPTISTDPVPAVAGPGNLEGRIGVTIE